MTFNKEILKITHNCQLFTDTTSDSTIFIKPGGTSSILCLEARNTLMKEKKHVNISTYSQTC